MSKIARNVHLWASIVFFIPFILISISGSVLVYRDEIEGFLHADEVFRSAQSI